MPAILAGGCFAFGISLMTGISVVFSGLISGAAMIFLSFRKRFSFGFGFTCLPVTNVSLCTVAIAFLTCMFLYAGRLTVMFCTVTFFILTL